MATDDTRKRIIDFVSSPQFVGMDTACELQDGEFCFRQGDADNRIGVVLNGHLILTQLNTEGVAVITAILYPGDVFGIGTAGHARNSHSGMAKGLTRVLFMAEQQFTRTAQDNPGFALDCVKLIAERERLLQRRLQATLTLDLRGRIAVVLGDLVSEHGKKCQHGHEIDISLTQQQLADLIGASRPAVSAELNALRREGLLGYTRDHICLNDLQALQALARELSSG